MKRVMAALGATVTALVLLFSYRTSLGDTVVALSGSAAKVVTAGSTGEVTSAASSPGAPGPNPSSSAVTVINGATEQTPYGPVQVQVTFTGAKISQITALQQPTADRRSQQINTVALPQLQSEALTAQSASIDVVSGATYTTQGYIASLQSAIDAAHRAA